MKKQILIALLIIASAGFTSISYAQDASRKGYEYYRANAKITSTDNGVIISFNHDVKSPRDVATGQSSGKRQHKPFNFAVSSSDNTITEEKKRIITAGATSSDKVSYSDLSVMISVNKGTFQKIPIENGEFTLPAVRDEDCDMVCSWSWGASNSGSARTCSVSFSLSFKDGVLMAINEQGVPSKKK